MTLGLRSRLLLVAVPPLVLLAVISGAGTPLPYVVTSAILAAGLVSLAVVALTLPFASLHDFASDTAKRVGFDTLPPSTFGSADGTALVANVVAALSGQVAALRAELAARDTQFRRTLADTTEILGGMAHDHRQPTRAARPDSPWASENAALSTAVANVAAALASGHRKAAGLQAVLHDIPDPVLVLDAKFATIFVNTAAEDWFARLPGRGLKQPFADFLTDAPPADPANADTTVPAGPAETLAWASSPRGGSLESTAETSDGPIPVLISKLPTRQRQAGTWLVLTFQDLTAAKKIDANVRNLHRRLTGQRMSLLVAREAGPALETIRLQAGLLSQAAKQAGQRERFVPKIQRILEEVDRQKLVIDQLGWLGRLTTTTVSEPDAQEVRLRTVADDVAEKLAPAFAERGNSLDLSGDAGWLIADEERIATVISGLLLHANSSCERVCVSVALSRRSSVAATDELGEVVVRYPGEAVTEVHLADVKDPFRRPNSGVTDATGKVGFLLGLAVTNKVAALMGGTLQIDGLDGVVTLRVAVPTRARTDNRAAARAAVAGPSVAGIDAQDALGDFFVGGGNAVVESQASTPAPAAVAFSLASGPADLAGEETLGSFFGPG